MAAKRLTSVHTLYLSDEKGGYNGHEVLKVFVDGKSLLQIGRRLGVPVVGIESCEVTPVPKGKGECITIVVRSPGLNGGARTPVHLTHKNFWANTKRAKLEAFVDEIAPLIRDNTFAAETVRDGVAKPGTPPAGSFEVSYAFNFSLLIAFYHKTWIAFDPPAKAIAKTWLLLLCSWLNVFGLLLLIIPYDNWVMSRNLTKLGCSRTHRTIAYIVSLLGPVAFWTLAILRESR